MHNMEEVPTCAFGLQLWFRKRDTLPRTDASTTKLCARKHEKGQFL
jgi:hypothetical protein